MNLHANHLDRYGQILTQQYIETLSNVAGIKESIRAYELELEKAENTEIKDEVLGILDHLAMELRITQALGKSQFTKLELVVGESKGHLEIDENVWKAAEV